MKPYLLQNEELKELVAKIPEWKIISDYIVREFNFDNFIEAFSFMTKTGFSWLSSSLCSLWTTTWFS